MNEALYSARMLALRLVLVMLASFVAAGCTRYEWACDYTATWSGSTTKAADSIRTQSYSPSTEALAKPVQRALACRYLCSERAKNEGKTGYETFAGPALEACNHDCEANAGPISLTCTRGREAPSSFGAWN